MNGPAPGLRLTGFFNFSPPHLNQWEVNRGQWRNQTHERPYDFLVCLRS